MFETLVKESIGKRISILFRLSMIHFRNEMKKLGLGAGDYGFIIMLFMDEGLSQDDLSKQMRVDKSYTARALARLEKMQMVERRPDPHEHRIKRVFLGQEARQIEADLFKVLKNWNSVLSKDIKAQDLELIRESMDKMTRNADAFLGLEENNI